MGKFLDIYTGRKGQTLPDFEPENRLNSPALYRPSKALKSAVNIAIRLGKPLLITGEPGTGKTQLAYNIAYSFDLGKPLVFNTRTSSIAGDLFYKYDALKHLQYVHAKQNTVLTDEEVEDKFIAYQALGQAIRSQQRAVVLIDEIDKAPRDLPNDILNVLEEMTFDVPEVNKKYAAPLAKRPIIVMTSNSEKNLPDAFLRRCVYYHINFPNEEELLNILSRKLASTVLTDADLKKYVLPHFLDIRKTLKRKKPSVSELLHWVTLLEQMEFPVRKLVDRGTLSTEEKDQLQMTYAVLAKNEDDVKIIHQFLR
ncbi:MAG: AAA family ATPase [Flammeovirgaceae bacterium]